MSMFNPVYTITFAMTQALVGIESVKQRVLDMPLSSYEYVSLREAARLATVHYSTMIEGNRLEAEQIDELIHHKGHFPGREREEEEVKGYYNALARVEQWAITKTVMSEHLVQQLHGLVIGSNKPTPYRDGQNVIRDGRTRRIVYMPPEAADVSPLMRNLISWINEQDQLPCPIVAGLVHYQFATIHPYYDGNGRTARLLTTLILHRGGYDLKGLYSLEEYYARNLGNYYDAISVGPSHNYYLGRAEADLTAWLTYFIEGMAFSCEKVLAQMKHAHKRGAPDAAADLRSLDPKQRKTLELFQEYRVVTAQQIGALFGFKDRTSRKLCAQWVEQQFLCIADASRKGRKYTLAAEYEHLVSEK